MKLKSCFLALLCLFFRAAAQEAQQDIKPVSIGQQVPDVRIENIQGLELGGREVTSARVSEFKGKLLIIDFWATWCSPCRAMVPVMDSLQRVFGDRVVFLPVTYETEAVASPVIAQMKKLYGSSLPEVTGDRVLARLFPHTSLPHYAWIDGGGVVRAITGLEAVTGANIRQVLAGAGNGLPLKQDLKIPYDNKALLFMGGNGGVGSGVVYHSVLSAYVPGLLGSTSVSAFDPLGGQKFTATNSPLIWLYRLAYGKGTDWFPNSRVRLLSRDSAKMYSRLSGQAYNDWLGAGNGWCYEMQVPPNLATQAFGLMQAELGRLFPAYSCSVERQAVKVLALVRTSAVDKLKSVADVRQVSAGPYECHLRHARLGDLIVRLNTQYQQRSKLPLVDATAYSGLVDLDLLAPLSDMAALNKALAAYDLRFEEREAPVDLLVIRDSVKP